MRLGVIIAVLVLALLGGAVYGCNGTQVRSGWVGVRVIDIGANAGVQDQELTPRWYGPVWGSYVLQFPTTARTEVWADSGDNRIGPAIQFRNADGVATSVSVSMQVRMDPNEASKAVQKYRLGFEDMIRGPVQRDLQDTFVRVGPQFNSAQLMSDGGSGLIAAVSDALRPRLEAEGIIIDNINLVGAPALPSEIMTRINARIEAEQNAATQQAQVAVVQMQAQQVIAEAEGRARALEIEGAAIRNNPEVLRIRAIERWSGQCPLESDTCVLGANALVSNNN